MPSKPIESHIERLVQAAGGWESVVDRIASGETVADVSRGFLRPDGIPISRAFFSRLLHNDPERSKRVFLARTEGAAAMVDIALHLVDSAPADRDSVNKAKVQAETRIKVAGFIDRANWGESKQSVNVQVNVADLHLDALRSRSVRLQADMSRPDHALPAGVARFVPVKDGSSNGEDGSRLDIETDESRGRGTERHESIGHGVLNGHTDDGVVTDGSGDS